MRKELFLLSALLLLAGSAAAEEVYYEIDVSQEQVLMNTTVVLECDGERCPTLRWAVPEDGEVLSIRDSSGKITDYEVENGGISVRPGNDRAKQQETFKLEFRVNREAEEIYNGLYKRQLSLRSFKGEETSGNIHVDNFLSGWTGYGVETSIEGNNLSFRTEGPLTFRVKFGDKGYSTKYYEFFGGRPENSSIAYEIAVGTTGEQLQVKRLPVALLPDDVFDEQLAPWSSGEYSDGSIRMRQHLTDSFLPVLAHETVHALNNRKLKWDRTSSAYFEEGTSRHIEYLVKKKLYREDRINIPPRELFGESVRYDPDESDRYYNTTPSKGSADVLWGYYQNNNEFMKQWNPFDSPAEYRGFGYAYSELIIKNHLMKNNATLSGVYENLNVEREISDPQEKWEIFSQHLDMTPCEYETRERFDQCLEDINDYNYTVYSAKPSSGNDEALQIEKLEIPEKEKKDPASGDINLQLRDDVQPNSILDSIFEALKSLLRQIMISLQTMLQ